MTFARRSFLSKEHRTKVTFSVLRIFLWFSVVLPAATIRRSWMKGVGGTFLFDFCNSPGRLDDLETKSVEGWPEVKGIDEEVQKRKKSEVETSSWHPRGARVCERPGTGDRGRDTFQL